MLVAKTFPFMFATPHDAVAGWIEFYRTEFGIELDTTSLVIPDQQPGFNRLLIIAKDLAILQVYARWMERFGPHPGHADTISGMDETLLINDRDSKDGTYALWVRDSAESREYVGDSPDDLVSAGFKGMTFLEYMLYALVYFMQTGAHLNTKSKSFCTGTRSRHDMYPGFWWDTSLNLISSWFHSGHSGERFAGFREVVTT